MFPIKYPGLGMRNPQEVEKRSLFDLILVILVCVIVRESPLSHCVKDISIKGSRVIDDIGLANQFYLPILIVREVGANSQGDNTLAISQSVFKGYSLSPQTVLCLAIN